MNNIDQTTTSHILTLTQNELEKQNHFIELLRDQVAELKLNLDQSNNSIKSYKSYCFEKDRQIKDLETGQSYYIGEVKVLKEKIKELEAQAHYRETRTKAANDALEPLIKEKEVLQERVNLLEKDNNSLIKQLVVSKSSIDLHVNKITELKQKAEKAQDSLEIAEESNNLRKQAILKMEREIRDLKKKTDYIFYEQRFWQEKEENQRLTQVYDKNLEHLRAELWKKDSIASLLLKFIDYLQWLNNCKSQQLEILAQEDTDHISALQNAIAHKEYALEKSNRRWTDLQTANCNLVAENKINRKKLALAYHIINFIPSQGFVSIRGQIREFMEFDKQPENQIDQVLTSLPSYSELEAQIEQLKNQLKENENSSDSTRIKELKEINHSLTNDLGLAQTRTQAAYASTQYYSSKLDLAHKILDRTGVLCSQLEFAPDVAKLIKEYTTFEHSHKKENK